MNWGFVFIGVLYKYTAVVSKPLYLSSAVRIVWYQSIVLLLSTWYNVAACIVAL